MHHNDRDNGQNEKPQKCSVLGSEFESKRQLAVFGLSGS